MLNKSTHKKTEMLLKEDRVSKSAIVSAIRKKSSQTAIIILSGQLSSIPVTLSEVIDEYITKPPQNFKDIPSSIIKHIENKQNNLSP